MSLVDLFALAALVASIASVVSRDPVYSALFLSVSALFVAAMYGAAGFTALVLLILVVYVGAVSMFIVFSAAMLGERLRRGVPKYFMAPLVALPLLLLLTPSIHEGFRGAAPIDVPSIALLAVVGVATLIVSAIFISSKWRRL